MLHTEEYIDIKDNICYILRNTLISRARDSYRGGRPGISPQKHFPPPPKKIHSVLTLFGIITTKCITSWMNEVCWQGYAYALKSAPELISEH